ncbi:MAG: UDP-glucose--hexose-1-phosphate uridylyltransferase [Desulfosarcinaceae bacterium]|nr:UDP-glucose--hexose-1-phosphate uridylyltransferase [Desulfosarcinaceae bacterium]
MDFSLKNHPHRRHNPLTGQWVLVSPHRAKRPWLGLEESAERTHRPEYDPECYLCPGNTRVGGETNPVYEGPFVFTNDFQALLPDTPQSPSPSTEDPLLRSQAVRGTCRVVCYSPRHDLSLSALQPGEMRAVVDVWADEVERLGGRYRWVQVFENRGAAMGCSNPHPHGQIWASDFLPQEAEREDRCQADYYRRHGETLLSAYLDRERRNGLRVISENRDWLILVPFWAVWPFETLVIPKQAVPRLPDVDAEARDSLAALLTRLLSAYDRLFNCGFPYSMGWHGAPSGNGEANHWHLHAHFYPPLLRSATVKKFMVGYELLAEVQRDLTAEQAAARLRRCFANAEGS